MTINSRMPVNRAGHTAVSTGSEALVCGGLKTNGGDKAVLVGDGKDLECWWFTPLPYPRFDPLNVSFTLESGTLIPSARWGHTMSYDPKLRNVLLFGGSANATLFNDCWALMLSGVTHSMHDRRCSTDSRFSLAFNSRHTLQLFPSILAGTVEALLSFDRQ